MKQSESEVSQSCLTLCYPMDCSLPGSSVHGIFQAKVLESYHSNSQFLTLSVLSIYLEYLIMLKISVVLNYNNVKNFHLKN